MVTLFVGRGIGKAWLEPFPRNGYCKMTNDEGQQMQL